jgi:methylmalonyl-CoA/ethylmalonyl-CoA epimerase
MTETKIHHIGIIVDDLESTVNRFKGFGLSLREVIENTEAGYKIAFFPVGDTLIEFVSYMKDDDENHMNRVVRSQKGMINHICLEVEDIDASIRKFEKNGARLVKGCPKAGITGRIAFFYPETTEGILIEVSESPKEAP